MVPNEENFSSTAINKKLVCSVFDGHPVRFGKVLQKMQSPCGLIISGKNFVQVTQIIPENNPKSGPRYDRTVHTLNGPPITFDGV